MNTVKLTNKGNCKIIAHRGLSGLERENTNSAFVAAGNRSYFGIETDVHPTADGKFILLHDDDTSRCGVDKIAPETATLETLQSIKLLDVNGQRDRADLRIPELKDYLRICKRYEKVCVLEFKGGYSVETLQQIVDIVKAEYSLDMVIFISFWFESLVNLRKVCPESHCQFLTGEYKEEIIQMLKEHKMGIDIWSNVLTEEARVKHLLEEGIEVNTWTVDNKECAEQLISWGVQYLTTNILE